MNTELNNNNNLILDDNLKKNVDQLINKGDVIIKIYSPYNTIFTTCKIKLDSVNTPLIVALLNNPTNFVYLKLPVDKTKHIVLPKDVISKSIFEIEFFETKVKKQKEKETITNDNN